MDVSIVNNNHAGNGAAYAAPKPQQETTLQLPVVKELQETTPEQNTLYNGQQRQYTRQEVEGEADKLTQTAQLFNTKLRFQVDDQSKELYVLVIDTNKNKVISRIPPENMFKISINMKNMVGILFDMFV